MTVVMRTERRANEHAVVAALSIDVIRRQLRIKDEIVGQVCRGQLPLQVAAARFRAASGLGTADEETVCRTLIAWVGLALADRPEWAAAVTERLASELELNLARGGRVQLPSQD
jgi:hypothetical protein